MSESFGPIDIHSSSLTFGHIIETSKPGWSGVNLLKVLSSALDTPIALDTDVHCAPIAEAVHGAGQNLSEFIYLTVGTGIGGGIMTGGDILYGAGHPEIGHISVAKETDDDFEGECRYHRDHCIEGLALGPATTKRRGLKPSEMETDHAAWDLEARYLAVLCHNLMMMIAPKNHHGRRRYEANPYLPFDPAKTPCPDQRFWCLLRINTRFVQGHCAVRS